MIHVEDKTRWKQHVHYKSGFRDGYHIVGNMIEAHQFFWYCLRAVSSLERITSSHNSVLSNLEYICFSDLYDSALESWVSNVKPCRWTIFWNIEMCKFAAGIKTCVHSCCKCTRADSCDEFFLRSFEIFRVQELEQKFFAKSFLDGDVDYVDCVFEYACWQLSAIVALSWFFIIFQIPLSKSFPLSPKKCLIIYALLSVLFFM